MTEKITFDALITAVAEKNEIPKTLSRTLIKEMALIIQEGLIRDEVVNLAGFGIFKIKNVAARQGRDPRTGETITIPAKKKVLFKPEKKLREEINKNFEHLQPQFLEKPTKSAVVNESEKKQISSVTFTGADKSKSGDEDSVLTEQNTKSERIAENKSLEQENFISGDAPKEEQNLTDAHQYDEDKKNRAPILIGIIAILIVLLIFWQMQTEESTPEQSEINPVAEQKIEKTDVPKNSEIKKSKPPPVNQPVEKKKTTEAHQTSDGDNLWNLAIEYYNDGYLWPLILLENADKVDNPDFIKPNTILNIPTLSSPGKLSQADYSNLAQGHLKAYLAYKESKREEARNHLFVANKYDENIVDSNISTIDKEDIQVIKNLSMR